MGLVGSKGEPAELVRRGRECFLWVQGEQFDWEDKLTTTLMKKLLSLAMLALVTMVIVGCEKKAEDPTAGAGAAATNAVPK